MRRIVVFGSNSFSGSDFVDLLLEDPGNEVLGISRSPEKTALFLPYKRHPAPRFRFEQLDFNKDMKEIHSQLDSFEPQYVVNFAAQNAVAPSWDNPDHWFQTNVMALIQLTNYLKDRKYLHRYVHVSSPDVYGTSDGAATESASMNPTTPCAVSKAAADLFLFTLVKKFNFPLVIIRASSVYGARQQMFKFIPRTVACLKNECTIQLHDDGRAVKSFIHVRDVSRGELLAMDKGQPGSIYHLSPDRGVAVRDVVRSICTLMNREFETSAETAVERLTDDVACVLDSSRSRQELGWRPVLTLDQGLSEVISWIDDNWDAIRWEPLEYVHKP